MGFDAIDNGATPDGAPAGDASTTDPIDAQRPNDGAINTDLQLIDNRPDNVVVRVDGRFSLTFSADHFWQVTDWRDLASDGATNLARNGAGIHESVLQSPLRVEYGADVLTLDNARNAIFELVSVTPTRIEFKTEWLWDTFDMNTMEGEATHVLRPDGTWTVEGEIKHKPGNLLLDRVDYASANVDGNLGWNDLAAGDFTSYTYTLNRPDGTASELHVTSQQMDNMTQGGDGNWYWTRNNVTATSDGWSVFWTNRIGPGGQGDR